MKAKTKVPGGRIWFAYFVAGSYSRHGNYDDAIRSAKASGGPVVLTGYLTSDYSGCREEIDEMELKERPTVSQVKKFIKGCIEAIEK